MTALVVDDDAVPIGEWCQLIAGSVSISGKAVRENDRRSFSERFYRDFEPVASDALQSASVNACRT